MYNAICKLLESSDFPVIEAIDVPERPAQFQEIPGFLFGSGVGDYLRRLSGNLGPEFSGLWTHQAQALEALGRGENVVVSTGTASGKSLIFRALTLHKLLTDPSSRTAVFYPLRALVADQLRGWREMAHSLGLDVNVVGQIDGSVPYDERDLVLQNARIIVMTPDVCQAWLMPRLAMPVVRRFMGNLSTLIMDEAHILEGVFGSNFAFLIRRMIAARNFLLSSQPDSSPLQLVAATATISSPSEHLKKLTGAEFATIDHEAEGAPRYGRIVAHVACPVGNDFKVAKELQQHALMHGKEGSFITFLDSRKGVETLAMATQEDLNELLSNPEIVSSYRGGFTPENRQRIEENLRSGAFRGVISTSALELGIDFPALSVGFNIGVPPTRKAYRQRLGRVGRSGPGLFILIAPPNAFRQFGTTLREYHDLSVEPSHLYLDNRFMQFAHGRCLYDELEALAATKGLPTRVRWPKGFSEVYKAAVPGGNRPPEFDAIAELGSDTPQRNYPLRNVGDLNLEIKVHENSDKIGDVTQTQALRECYPGAVYFHEMRSYRVAAWKTRAYAPYIQVRNTSPRISTRPQITTWINTGITESDLIDGHLLRGEGTFLAECQMLITERVNGYFEGGNGKFNSYQDLQKRNPSMKARLRNFRTSGVVLCIDKDWFKRGMTKQIISDRLREVFSHEYSVLPQDIGSGATRIAVRDSDGNVWRGGCIAVFDETYGSLRLTEKLYIEFDHILERLAKAFAAEDGTGELKNAVDRIRREVSELIPANPFSLAEVGDQHHRGHLQVFAKGSIVCYRESGQIAVDVEVIEPTIMDGELRYRVQVPPLRGQTPLKRWILASKVEPSADADAWEYASWNCETEVYESPPDEVETED